MVILALQILAVRIEKLAFMNPTITTLAQITSFVLLKITAAVVSALELLVPVAMVTPVRPTLAAKIPTPV